MIGCCRKNTKKTSIKAGRKKKAKTGDIPAPVEATPRTGAAVDRKAAVKARLEAEQAEAKARAALEAAQAAAREANRDLLDELVPLEIEPPQPATPSGPSSRRYIVFSL
jgi:hypothetical protein